MEEAGMKGKEGYKQLGELPREIDLFLGVLLFTGRQQQSLSCPSVWYTGTIFFQARTLQSLAVFFSAVKREPFEKKRSL